MATVSTRRIDQIEGFKVNEDLLGLEDKVKATQVVPMVSVQQILPQTNESTVKPSEISELKDL